MFSRCGMLSCLIFLTGNSFFITAQNKTDEPGNWFMLYNQTRFHKNWSTHADIQYRNYTITPNAEQLLMRVGLNFHFDPNVVFTAGCAWVTTYNNDYEFFKPQIMEENRVWEQIQLKNIFGRINFTHQYRLEQRWIERNSKVNYQNRIRYLLRLIIPINKKELTTGTLFTNCYNEVFIKIDNSPFERNRLFGALGYQFNALSNVQVGYLLQTVNTLARAYLQLSLTYNIDTRKTK